MIKIFLFSSIALFGLTLMAGEATVKSDLSDQTGLNLTIYTADRALVNDVRNLNLPGGQVDLWFQDVAAHIIPETVAIKAVDGTSFHVLEQNYEYDLLSPDKILNKYIGKEVILIQQVMRENSTVNNRTMGLLLSTNNGTVWKIKDKIVVNPPYVSLEFPDLPDNLFAKPTLVWLLSSKKGKSTVAASYLTTGMTWKADYVFTLSAENDASGDMMGWVTIKNNSGTLYRDAKVKLIAGDIHTAQAQPPMPRMMMKAEAAGAPQFKEKTFFEYHMYTLQRPTTIHDNQQKQIQLLQTPGVKVVKNYILRGQSWYFNQRSGQKQTQKVSVVLDLANTAKNGLGIPLPKGTVRLYKKDTDGSSQLIGEDTIDHTPKDETVHLTLGDAFDIVAERRQTDFRNLSNCLHESAYEIKIRNHKKGGVTVKVVEPINGDWEILSSSVKYKKIDAFTIEFAVPVNADGEAILTYRIRVKTC